MIDFLTGEASLEEDEAENVISDVDEKILSPLREKIEKDGEIAKEQTTTTADPYLEEIE